MSIEKIFMTPGNDRAAADDARRMSPGVLSHTPDVGIKPHKQAIPILELTAASLLVATLVLILNGQILMGIAAGVAALTIYPLLVQLWPVGHASSIFGLVLFSSSLFVIGLPDVAYVAKLAAGAAALSGAALFFLQRLREIDQSASVARYTSMLLFEGRIGSAQYHDQRVELCDKFLVLSERSGRALSVLALRWRCFTRQSASDSSGDDGTEDRFLVRNIDRHFLRMDLSTYIGDNVRGSDILIPDAQEDELFLVCPDTDGAGIAAMKLRLEGLLREHWQCEIDFGHASYPDDGISTIELIQSARRRMTRTSPISVVGQG